MPVHVTERTDETFVPLPVEITKREQSNIFGRRNTKRRPVAIVSIIGGTVCTSVTYRERARGIGQRRCKANMRVQRTAVIYEALEDCILSSRSPGGSRLSTGAIHGPSGNIFMGGATPAAAKPNWMRLFFVLQSAWLAWHLARFTGRPVFHTSLLIAPPMRSDNRPNSVRRSLIFGRR